LRVPFTEFVQQKLYLENIKYHKPKLIYVN